jgi:hypothetical protein
MGAGHSSVVRAIYSASRLPLERLPLFLRQLNGSAISHGFTSAAIDAGGRGSNPYVSSALKKIILAADDWDKSG